MDIPFLLKGKDLLITGASSGIGRAVAIRCSARGANIHLTARNTERLEETQSMLSKEGTHQRYSVDLKDDLALDHLTKSLPELDGVVLNAGVVKLAPVNFVNRNVIEELFNVNLHSSILLVHNLLKKKKLKKGGSVCFISSIASQFVTPGNSIYSASKGAVNSFAKSLALELAPKGIRVNAILPGFVETGLLTEGPLSESEIKEHMKNYPIGRYGRPDDIAYLAVYLLSDEATWMTGSLLTMDGGYSLK